MSDFRNDMNNPNPEQPVRRRRSARYENGGAQQVPPQNAANQGMPAADATRAVPPVRPAMNGQTQMHQPVNGVRAGQPRQPVGQTQQAQPVAPRQPVGAQRSYPQGQGYNQPRYPQDQQRRPAQGPYQGSSYQSGPYQQGNPYQQNGGQGAYNPYNNLQGRPEPHQKMNRTGEIPMEPQLADQVEPPRKKRHGLLITLIVLVLVMALAVVGMMFLPEDTDGVLGTVRNTVVNTINGVLGKDTAKKAKVELLDLSAANTEGEAPESVIFTLTTTKDTNAVRLTDENGDVMAMSETPTTDNEDSRIWMLTMNIQDGYEGMVTTEITAGDEWLTTYRTQTIQIAPVQQQPIDTVAFNPEATEEPAPTEAPTAVPTEAPTAEPTVEATATPTVPPTEAPTEEPTEAPTAEPTPEPTPEVTEEPTPMPTITPGPSPTPTAAPTEQPAMTASFDGADADPSQMKAAFIYSGSKTLNVYDRIAKDQVRMNGGDDYTTLPGGKPFGVMTFRGNAFRQNAAIGTVGDISKMSVAWQTPAGSLASSGNTVYYGIGEGAQPAIIKWSKEIREASNMYTDKQSTPALKEVIIAGLDGKIYFLDLADGSATRDAINFGYPMKSTVSLHPLGYPIMAVGQYARKVKSGMGKTVDLTFYNAMTQSKLYSINGLDGNKKRAYSDLGYFNTSPLFDRNSDTMVTVGSNGMLYVTKLNTEFDYGLGTLKIKPETINLATKYSKQKDETTAVESSLAMYGSYAFYADMAGILRCVDTTTMTVKWAVKTGDAVTAAISLELDENGKLWLYTANTLDNRSKGDCEIRRYDAMTGRQDWICSIPVMKDGKATVAGASASAIVGRGDIDDLVIYTVSYIKKDGPDIAGAEAGGKTTPGAVIAVRKADGKIAWTRALDSASHSSPIAVYTEGGKSYVVAASGKGMLYLLEGTTGSVINTLQLEGNIEGSPAAYDNTVVIGTTGKGKSYIYGITLE
ncbi:MAG: PQQ-binding-like beta-propeller repeat protein [Clostridia bacterium]|nr:PQQ-binding-like beta-propeller repeat protein [Clostridia bacterium]